MRCRKAKKAISLYLDKELEQREEERLLSHIHSCERCQKEMQATSTLWENISPPPNVEPSAYFLSQIKARIKSCPGSFALFPLRWRLIPAAAGLLAILALVPFLSGIFMGKAYITQSADIASASYEEVKAILGLDIFDDSPPHSLSDAYNEITGGV